MQPILAKILGQKLPVSESAHPVQSDEQSSQNVVQ